MKKIIINENFEVEYTNELNLAMTELAIMLGDDLKRMQPLEKFYALKIMCEEIEARCVLYTGIQKVRDENTQQHAEKDL
jgi:hypothetical protein